MTRLKAFHDKYALFLNAAQSSLVSSSGPSMSAAAVNRSAISQYFR